MGKQNTDNTEEMIRQIRETRKNLAASLYNDFFAAGNQPAGETASSDHPAEAGSAAAAPKKAKPPVQAATGPAPKAQQEIPVKAEPQEDPMETLQSLIGLEKIKHDVKELTDFAKIQKARQEAGLKTVPVSLHLVFTGNPGTGKTTVARILAKLYQKIGVLSQGQLIEVDRSGLVAGYVGQTALKTQEQIQKALGGVLFIDEAYTLASKTDDFGQEAIDTILKAMEDHRDDLIVIVAGYTEPMERFINSNPGLKSRFNKYIEFPDYTIDELMAIFDQNLEKNDYIIDESARGHVREKLTLMKLSSPENFANARAVRNLFEEIITNQASRIAAMEKPSKEDLKRLTNADLTDEEDEKLSAIALADTLSSGALTAEREESAKEQRPLDEVKEPAPEKAPSEKTSPGKPVPEETSTEKTSSEKPVPEETSPEKTSPEKPVPEETSPEKPPQEDA